MPTPFHLAFGVAVLVGLGSLVVFTLRLARAYLAYRGTLVVACPGSHEMAAVQVDAGGAALGVARGRPRLHLVLCTHWPEKAACGQECLDQIEATPQACLLRNILRYWYEGKSCVDCGRPFGAIRWRDPEPGLLRPDGALVTWDGFRPEQVLDVLATHRPLCGECRGAQSLRRKHPIS